MPICEFFEFGFRIVRFVLISDFGFRFRTIVLEDWKTWRHGAEKQQGVGILLSICILIQTRKCRKSTLTVVIHHSEDGAGWRLMDDWEDADDLFGVNHIGEDSVIREDLHSASRFLVL